MEPGPDAPCPPRAQLEAFALGTLGPDAAALLKAHLETCVSCGAALFAFQTAQSNLTQRTPDTPGDGATPGSRLIRGQTVGRYVLLDPLGEGGVGVVYAAYDPELDRKVAVKLLQSRSAAPHQTEGTALIIREAQMMAKLSHPNVVAIHDVGHSQGHGAFIAMELVDGSSLRGWLKQGPHPWREAVAIYRAAGEGLAAAHARGLVHADFKPDNVLMRADGRVQVMDFGLARSHAAAQADPSGRLEGTLVYLAPEQLEGAPPGPLTDQFSFGVALHESLYGVRPFSGSPLTRPPETRWRISEPPPGREVPGWVRRVVLRALAVDPAQRFADMQALLAALARDPALRRRRVAALAGAAALVAASVLTVRSALNYRSELCLGAEQQLADVWDGPRQAQVRAALLFAPSEAASNAWERTRQVLDGVAREWVGMRTEACRATRVRGEQSQDVMALRLACLDQRLLEFSALSRALSTPDPQLPLKAPLAADALASLLPRCADLTALQAAARPTVRPEDRPKVEAQKRRLAEAKTLFDTGKLAPALQETDAALQVLPGLGDPHLLSDAYTLRASVLYNQGKPEGLVAYDQAIASAWAATELANLRTALTGSLSLQANLKSYDKLTLYLELGDAVHGQPGVPPLDKGRWLAARAYLDKNLNHAEPSLRRAMEAMEVVRGVSAESAMSRAGVLSLIAAALRQPGYAEKAAEVDFEVVALRRKVLGELHPRVANAYLNLSASLITAARYEQGLEYATKARELFARLSGPNGPIHALNTLNVAEAHIALGRPEQARPLLEDALRAARASVGQTHGITLMVLNSLAYISLESDPAEAARLYRFTLESSLKELPDDPERLRSVVGEARTRARLSRAEAQRAVERISGALAVQAKSSDGSRALDLALGAVALAEAQALAEPSSDQWQKTARSAQEQLTALRRFSEAARVAAWLERRAQKPAPRREGAARAESARAR